MGEVVEDVFARRDVDANVVPFLGRDLGEPALHQRLAGRDDLDDGGMAVGQVLLDRTDQRRRLHAGKQVAEETLLGALEGRAGRRLRLPVQRAGLAGDVRRLHRGVEMVVDDGEGAGIGVVDAPLLGGELVFDQLVFDAVIGERAGGVETERPQIAGEHLHGGDTAILDRLDELGAGGEGEVLAAPEAEPLGVGEIVDGRRARGRDIDDARVRQGVLQAQARTALLRGRNIASFSFAATGILHGVALVENDHSVEVGAQPFDDLPDAGKLLAAVVGPQRSVGGRNRTPSERRIGLPWGKRESGVISRRSMPSADQSRWASSISLSDLEIQTALRRPFSQLSRMMPADWRPLPAPVPSPSMNPRRKRTAFGASSRAAVTRSKVSSTVQAPAR